VVSPTTSLPSLQSIAGRIATARRLQSPLENAADWDPLCLLVGSPLSTQRTLDRVDPLKFAGSADHPCSLAPAPFRHHDYSPRRAAKSTSILHPSTYLLSVRLLSALHFLRSPLAPFPSPCHRLHLLGWGSCPPRLDPTSTPTRSHRYRYRSITRHRPVPRPAPALALARAWSDRLDPNPRHPRRWPLRGTRRTWLHSRDGRNRCTSTRPAPTGVDVRGPVRRARALGRCAMEWCFLLGAGRLCRVYSPLAWARVWVVKRH
jgi:hypothetical protein